MDILSLPDNEPFIAGTDESIDICSNQIMKLSDASICHCRRGKARIEIDMQAYELTENTQIKRQPFIAHAGRIAADTDGRDDVIRIGYRLLRTGGQCELHGRAQHARNVRRQTAVDAELFRIVIHKYQLVDMQLLRTLCNALCEEHGAYTAAADYR